MAQKKVFFVGLCNHNENMDDSRVISETFGVSNVTRQYIYYFQWEFWKRTISIYEVFDCRIFKSFSLHCSLLLTIYIIQKTNSCIDNFTFYLYRYHLFLVSIYHERYLFIYLQLHWENSFFDIRSKKKFLWIKESFVNWRYMLMLIVGFRVQG